MLRRAFAFVLGTFCFAVAIVLVISLGGNPGAAAVLGAAFVLPAAAFFTVALR
jgi:uncharacterized MAPEG superfamily protein